MRFFKKLKQLFNRYLAFNILFLIVLASSWSLLYPQFFKTHDYVHGVRIAEMARALSDGHFPVRWTKNFGFGFGMPLFEFYGPLPYYVGSLFYFLGFNLVSSTKILFWIANIFTALGAYYLGKTFFSKNNKDNKLAGFLVSAAITLAPYRAVNLFIRGAIGEAWGIMAMPWILYFLIKFINKKTAGNFSGLVLSLLILMLSHNLSTLMFLPFSVLFALTLAAQYIVQLKKTILKLAGAYLLAIGMASFYLLPAFFEKNLTQIDSILSGYFHYSNHFLYIRQFFIPHWGYGGSAWGPNDEISFFLGYGQLAALLLSAIFFVKNFLKSKKVNFIYLSILFFFTLSLFFSILKSKFLWDSLPLLNFIQFPWRFLSVAIIFLGLLVAYPLEFFKPKISQIFYVWILFLIIVVGNFYYFRPEKFMSNAMDLYYDDEIKTRYQMSDILRDYVPVQMSLDGEELKQMHQDFSFPGEFGLMIDKTHQKLYDFNLEEAQTVNFPIAFFPGWQAELDGEKIEVWADENNGLLSANLPEGKHKISLYFGKNQIKFCADLISFFSFLVFLYFLPMWTKKSS